MNVKDFLSAKEEEEIIAAIQQAEKNTSGEIRVHIEKSCKTEPFKRAVEVFHQLKMNETKQKNGVLIYVGLESKSFAIYGDEGIDKVIPKNFWNATRNVMQTEFKQGNFKDGLVKGVLQAGKQLQQHFPWTSTDTNELSDTISKG